VARQLVQDFGENVTVTYHDLAKPGTEMPAELAADIEQQHLPYPVSVVDGKIVSAGDVSYFVLAENIGQALGQPV